MISILKNSHRDSQSVTYSTGSSNICKSLATSFEIPDIREADLQAEAEAYLLEIGLTADEIAQVRANLGEKNTPGNHSRQSPETE